MGGSPGILRLSGRSGSHLSDVAFRGHDQGGVQAAPLLAGDLDQLGVDLLREANRDLHELSFRHATSVAARWRHCSYRSPPPVDVVAISHYTLSGKRVQVAITIRVYVEGKLVGEGEVPGPLVTMRPAGTKTPKGGRRDGR
jgi:hypothetical protein